MRMLMDLVLIVQQYSVAVVFVVFTLLVATVYWPGRRARFDRDARIPLEDDR